MVLERFVEMLDAAGGEGVAVDVQDEGEDFEGVVPEHPVDAHLVHIGPCFVLEQQVLRDFRELLAVF